MRLVRMALVFALALGFCAEVAAQYGGRRGAQDGRSEQKRDEVTTINANDQARLQLANARSALKLTPEQAPAWQVYENRVVGLLDDLSRGVNQPTDGGALKQINARVDVVRNRLAAMEDIADAAAKLFGVLSEEQKTTADRVLASTLPTLYSGAPARPAGDAGRMRPPR